MLQAMKQWQAKCRLQRKEKLFFTGENVLLQGVICLFGREWKENLQINDSLMVKLQILWQVCIRGKNAQCKLKHQNCWMDKNLPDSV